MEIYSFLPFCVLRIVKLVFIFVTMSNTLLPRFQEEAQSLFIMERFYKKSLIFSLLLIGIFQFVFAQNGTYSKRYYKQQKVTFNRPNGAYTNQLLLEDFGNGKYETFNFKKLKLIKRATLEEHKAAIKDGNLWISDGWDEWCKLVREKSKEYYQEDGDKK
mgnify:CR=1 FL=1